MYGSTVEDVMTGLKVHSLGWHSVYIIPEQLVAIISGYVRPMTGKYVMLRDKLLAEYLCSVWVVTNLLPFVKGLVRKGKRGIPWSVVIKSAALALLLCTTWTQI